MERKQLNDTLQAYRMATEHARERFEVETALIPLRSEEVALAKELFAALLNPDIEADERFSEVEQMGDIHDDDSHFLVSRTLNIDGSMVAISAKSSSPLAALQEESFVAELINEAGYMLVGGGQDERMVSSLVTIEIDSFGEAEAGPDDLETLQALYQTVFGSTAADS